MITLTSYQSVNNGLSLNWILDIEAAKRMAGEENKNILISFAGSDWCKPCIILTSEVFETETFKNYAEKHLVLVQADFPRYKKNRLPEDQVAKNEKLARQFNKDGAFPLVVLINPEGKVLGKTGYRSGGPDEYITHLKTLLANQQ